MPPTWPISQSASSPQPLKPTPLESARHHLALPQPPLPTANLGRSTHLLGPGRAEASQASWMVTRMPEGYLSDSGFTDNSKHLPKLDRSPTCIHVLKFLGLYNERQEENINFTV